MGKARWGVVLRRVHDLLDEGAMGAVGDADLLRRYTDGGREAAERAFAALVDRHGPMVLRTCRSILRDEHAAQDAFQATFLVLARRARALWVEASIAPWLYQVAVRTSSSARNTEARRRRHERRAAERASPEVRPLESDERGPFLHQEIHRLPERYRAAIVLCYLEGLTHEQAAERLGCPVGTVRSRLAAGRDRLRRRLILRGMAPEDEPLEHRTPEDVAPAVPPALAGSVIRNAMVQAGATATGVVPTAVASLAREELKKMMLAQVRNWTLGLLVVAGGASAGVLAMAQRPEQAVQPAPAGPQAKGGVPIPRPGRPFLEARIETARNIVKMDLERLRLMGAARPFEHSTFEQIPAWSRRLMEDRLQLASTPAERLAAIREHRNLMITMEQIGRDYYQAGQAQPSDSLRGRYYRLEADQLLAEAGMDPGKEPNPAEPKGNAAPPPPPPPTTSAPARPR